MTPRPPPGSERHPAAGGLSGAQPSEGSASWGRLALGLWLCATASAHAAEPPVEALAPDGADGVFVALGGAAPELVHLDAEAHAIARRSLDGLAVDGLLATPDGVYVSGALSPGGATLIRLSRALDVETWRRGFALGAPSFGRRLARAPDGDVLWVGAVTGPTGLRDDEPSPLGGPDGVLVRLGPEGNARWVRRFGTPGEDTLRDVAVAPDGRIAVSGAFGGPLAEGEPLGPRDDRALVVGPARLAHRGIDDAFIAVLTPQGDSQGAVAVGRPGFDVAKPVAFTGDGWLFGGSVRDEAGTAGLITSPGRLSGFFARVDAAATHVDVVRPPALVSVHALSVDGGGVLAAGHVVDGDGTAAALLAWSGAAPPVERARCAAQGHHALGYAVVSGHQVWLGGASPEPVRCIGLEAVPGFGFLARGPAARP